MSWVAKGGAAEAASEGPTAAVDDMSTLRLRQGLDLLCVCHQGSRLEEVVHRWILRQDVGIASRDMAG